MLNISPIGMFALIVVLLGLTVTVLEGLGFVVTYRFTKDQHLSFFWWLAIFLYLTSDHRYHQTYWRG